MQNVYSNDKPTFLFIIFSLIPNSDFRAERKSRMCGFRQNRTFGKRQEAYQQMILQYLVQIIIVFFE